MIKQFRISGAIIVVSLFVSLLANAEQSEKRLRALDTLWAAYTEYQLGDMKTALRGVTAALAIDPDLAYANIVRAEIAMKEQDWSTAQFHFERGLLLLEQPDQPLSPVESVEISAREVEGDSRCFLGYVYVKLAQQANQGGDSSSEEQFLSRAHSNLTAGLSLEPGSEARDLAQGLLKLFQ